MSEDLKPCPFCGGTNIELRDNGIGDSYAICYSDDPSEVACGARTDDANCETDESANSRWNKRASPPGGEWTLGQQVAVRSTYKYAADWQSATLFICGIDAKPVTGKVLLSVSEHWPPKGLGDITTDFTEDDLGPCVPAPPHQPGGEWQGIDTASQSQPVAMTPKSASASAEPSAAWRPEVVAFAHLMERQLRANDFKGGWKDDLPGDLFDHLAVEVAVLSDALKQHGKQREWGDAALYLDSAIRNVAEEAADVANMAMMIVDVSGALPAPPREAVGVGIEGASRTESSDARCDATAEDVQRKSEGGA